MNAISMSRGQEGGRTRRVLPQPSGRCKGWVFAAASLGGCDPAASAAPLRRPAGCGAQWGSSRMETETGDPR